MRTRKYVAICTMWVLLSCGKDQIPTTPLGPAPVPTTPSNPTAGPLAIGYVFDTAFQGLAGVHVEIVDGPAAGASATSAADGRFLLPVTLVPPDRDFTVRATKAGYLTVLELAHWYGTPFGAFFSGSVFLALTDQPAVFESGAYSLTIDFPCMGIPADLRTQTFPATVTPLPNGPLSVPGFRVAIDERRVRPANGFVFGVAGRNVGVPCEQLSWEVPPLRYLEADFGQEEEVQVVLANASSFSIPANGRYCELNSPMGAGSYCFSSPALQVVAQVRCPDSRLTLTRR